MCVDGFAMRNQLAVLDYNDYHVRETAMTMHGWGPPIINSKVFWKDEGMGRHAPIFLGGSLFLERAVSDNPVIHSSKRVL